MHLSMHFVKLVLISALMFCLFVHVHGAVYPYAWCWLRPLRRSEGRGRDSVVLELMLQHGPEQTMKMQ